MEENNDKNDSQLLLLPINQVVATDCNADCFVKKLNKIIQPHERSERGCTKSYRGLVQHFWSLNDNFLIARRSSLEILVFSPRSKFGGAKRPARTGREDGRKKKLTIFFSKARILACKKADFSTFRTVNDHF